MQSASIGMGVVGKSGDKKRPKHISKTNDNSFVSIRGFEVKPLILTKTQSQI